MGRLSLIYLDHQFLYICPCGTHLSDCDEIISKDYRGSSGTAYLFNKVYNFTAGMLEDRPMSSGLHTVCDIYCVSCQSRIGWKYVSSLN